MCVIKDLFLFFYLFLVFKETCKQSSAIIYSTENKKCEKGSNKLKTIDFNLYSKVIFFLKTTVRYIQIKSSNKI